MIQLSITRISERNSTFVIFAIAKLFYQENQKLKERARWSWYLIKYLTKLICIDFFPFPFWNGRKWKSWYMLKTRKLTWLYLQQSVYKKTLEFLMKCLKLKSCFLSRLIWRCTIYVSLFFILRTSRRIHFSRISCDLQT